MSPRSTLAYAKKVLHIESKAIASLERRLDGSFVKAVDAVLACRGHVVVTAIGKPGFIAQKLSATLASIGVPSLYLHPAEAAHGDLGRVRKGDVVVALSNSGSTPELLLLLRPLALIGVTLVAITGDRKSRLARAADLLLDIGVIDEASPLGLVPTASSAALHAMTDALAMCVAHQRELTAEQYARLHPGGKLGRSVLRVREVMRGGDAHPCVKESARLSEVVVVMTNTPGRPGAANVVDGKGMLVGIFTDGDLRRLAERNTLDFKVRVSDVMGRNPRFVLPEELVLEAAARMREAQVDQLPVVDGDGRAVGLLDVQDLLAARLV
jgi:arabinose-5-phosphate isomerase